MRAARPSLIGVLALCLLFASASLLRAQSLDLQVESGEIYAELPFVLSLTAQGFDETPAPEAPDLVIEGCRVTFLGTTPNVSQSIRIINGRRSESRQVSYVFRYRVTAPRVGSYTVPALTVTQGSRKASTRPASFTVREIAETRDMRIGLHLPDRPVWIGETFDVSIEWLLRRDVKDHNFVVPLFDLDYVQVQPGPLQSERTLTFPAGRMNIDLPYTQDNVNLAGVRYTRFRFPARVTVNRAGPLDLEPIKVAASLETGARRDVFGFRVPKYDLFSAAGKRQHLSVRPLPQQGRPDSFENAIGTAYSISVQAERTVVRVGDPVELDILVRGDGPLEGLSLPPLDGADGLPPQIFSIPDRQPVGELVPEENGKKFRVTVRVRSADAREIPALAFSYFDPVAAEYRTVHSQPIALSVAGSAVVDASDVMAAAPATATSQAPAGETADAAARVTSLTGADLSLSERSATLRGVLSPATGKTLASILYVLPLLILAARVWQVRTRGSRARDRRVKEALRLLETALNGTAPARDAAPRITSALRNLARLTGQESALRATVLEEIENRSFDPQAAGEALSPDLVARVRDLARGWVEAGSGAAGSSPPAALFVLAAVLGSMAAAGNARADEAGERVQEARRTYGEALEEADRLRRTRLFSRASQIYAELAHDHRDCPALLTDWGNAALGAQEIGYATLAYRRALQLDPDQDRANKNLSWLRERAPEWLPRPAARGAIDSLFFWHHMLSISQRILLGAAAFAAALLLLAPWSAKRARLLRRLAVPLLLVWIATLGSALLTPEAGRDAVILEDGTALRSADSLGAPPALANPLPAGTELRVLDTRGVWTRVALADGTRGWVSSGSLQSVAWPSSDSERTD